MDYVSKIKVLSWNVRGLNEREKRLAVRQTVLLEKPDIVCFQETKLSNINNTIISQTCGKRFKDLACLEADGTRGGIMVAWNSKYKLIQSSKGVYTATVTLEHNGDQFQITSVYGPTTVALRRDFFREIQEIKPSDDVPWLLCGDFNVTFLQEERTNLNSGNWRESLKFADLLMEMDLINLPLSGKNFTWTNSREQPTMAHLDRFLLLVSWSVAFPNSKQEAVANTSSDHTPLIYTANTNFRRTAFFRFENVWLNSAPFKEFVINSWQEAGIAASTVELHNKLCTLQSQIKE